MYDTPVRAKSPPAVPTRRRYPGPLAAGMAAALGLAVAVPGLQAQAAIDTLALRAHTAFLADDLLLGRATGTPGADIAARYIAATCRRLGLDAPAGEYLLPVPLFEARVLPASRLVLQRGAAASTFTAPGDFTLNVGTRDALRDASGPAVYVGDADVLPIEPATAAALRGAIAVTLGVTDPRTLDTLARLGVAATIHLVGDDAYGLYVRSRGDTRLYSADSAVRSSFLPRRPSLIAGPRLSAALAQRVGSAGADRPAPRPLGVHVNLHLAVEERPISGDNVACLLPGADPAARDTAIVFVAHFDHLGIGPPDATGDSIYNGFSDNAAGVAMILAIAEALQRDATPLRSSALFLFFTGEERGLLGSDHYVTHPLWPLGRTRAVINLDAGAPPAPPVTWRLATADSAGVGAIALAVARAQGWTATRSDARPNSDHYPFARAGVPALFIIPGPGPYEGLTADSSNALRRRWDRYHQAGDAWFDDFPFAGLARYAGYAHLTALALDGRP